MLSFPPARATQPPDTEVGPPTPLDGSFRADVASTRSRITHSFEHKSGSVSANEQPCCTASFESQRVIIAVANTQVTDARLATQMHPCCTRVADCQYLDGQFAFSRGYQGLPIRFAGRAVSECVADRLLERQRPPGGVCGCECVWVADAGYVETASLIETVGR